MIDRYYSIHGTLRIRIIGSNDPIVEIIDKTLGHFRAKSGDSDLTLVLGSYPTDDWSPKGFSVGDRILYDPETEETTVFVNPTKLHPDKNDVEYIVMGDIRKHKQRVSVYTPRLRSRQGYLGAIARELRRRNWSRAVFAALDKSFHFVIPAESHAALIRLAILEPFLYYRLPQLGYSLMHGSVVSKEGRGILFGGSGHVGKTTLALVFLKNGYSYLGDDLTIADGRGEALTYPEPVRLEAQHLAIFPDLADTISRKISPLARYFFKGRVGSSPAQLLSLMPRMQVNEIFDDVSIDERCQLDLVVLIKRGVVREASTEEIDTKSLADILGAELFWEFEAAAWRHTQYSYCPSCALGRDFIEEQGDLHKKMTSILSGTVEKARKFKLELPINSSIQETSRQVEALVDKT